MPSGYTADVQNGKITEFKDFALQCARAFGALISMRDEPMSAALPSKIEPSTSYHDKALADATKRLGKLRGMSAATAEREAKAAHAKLVAAYEEAAAEKKAQRARYDAMLEKVKAWEPPTKDHTELKKFMRDQLGESIKFDCYDPIPPGPQATGAEWLAAEIRNAENNVEYHTEERAKELKRAEGRNDWLQQLRKSL